MLSSLLKQHTITNYLKNLQILAKNQSIIDFMVRNRLADGSETLFSVFKRSTDFLAEAGEKFYGKNQTHQKKKAFYSSVTNFDILLGSPILTNAGRNIHKPISACAIPSISLSKSSKDQILQTVSSYHTSGMGTGFNLNDLEDPVEMTLYLNSIAIQEVQTGKIERSVGNMGVLSIDHPKVLEFIQIKPNHPEIREWKFNLSINLTQRFIDAWESHSMFQLQDGSFVDPDRLMDAIAASAHATGDPGIIFLDKINNHNKTPQIGRYTTVVPCGEVSLFEGEVCQFSYLNLPNFMIGSQIDYHRLKEVVHLLVTLLDNAVEANIDRMPTKQSSQIIESVRRIGIGICGFAEVLQQMNIAYDSHEGRMVARDIMGFIQFHSKLASVLLAKERGPFPAFDHPDTKKELFLKPFIHVSGKQVTPQDWNHLNHLFELHKIRNIATTILPPTGRSSLIGGVTGSIEPTFRFFLDNRFKAILSKHAFQAGYRSSMEPIYEIIKNSGSIQSTDLPNQVKKIFKTASELSSEAHLLMTDEFQKNTDEGISKTVNLTSNSTIEQIKEIFKFCCHSNLKGITVYRDQSRILQPKALNSDTLKEARMTIEPIYGPMQFSSKITSLLESPLISRLHGIHQNGTNYLIDPRQATSRYEHCLGVLCLTKILGGTEEDQIKVLFHDVSHTSFSHIIDLVFKQKDQNYHGMIREEFLTSDFAQATLSRFNLTKNDLQYEDLPFMKGSLNVDRLDYMIRDLKAVGKIYQPEYASIINQLVIDHGELKCKNLATARLIFNKFLEVNTEVYFSPQAEVAAVCMTTILQSLLRQNVLTRNDFLKSDSELIEIINQTSLKSILEKIDGKVSFSILKDPGTLPPVLRKLRHINPKIVGYEGVLTDHCLESKKKLDNYLQTTPKAVYYDIPMLNGVV